MNNITRTNICEDILLVMFNQYYVRLYNINWIKENSKVLKMNEMKIHQRISDSGLEDPNGLDQNGLPLDLLLKNQPPILFQIQ